MLNIVRSDMEGLFSFFTQCPLNRCNLCQAQSIRNQEDNTRLNKKLSNDIHNSRQFPNCFNRCDCFKYYMFGKLISHCNLTQANSNMIKVDGMFCVFLPFIICQSHSQRVLHANIVQNQINRMIYRIDYFRPDQFGLNQY